MLRRLEMAHRGAEGVAKHVVRMLMSQVRGGRGGKRWFFVMSMLTLTNRLKATGSRRDVTCVLLL